MLSRKILTRVLIFGIFITTSFAFAQNRTITGTITSFEGDPLLGVNIIQKGTSNGVVSDFDGNYEIQLVPGNETLVYSFVGYVSVERAVSAGSTVNVTLQTNSENLDEVVVIGYGTQRKGELTGAISSIKAKDLEDQVYMSIGQTLQGQAAGVFVNEDSGEPGGGISINIRGINSISGSTQPLYVLDGIPLGLDTQAQNDQYLTPTNPLASLNPNDIESIEVLKDASATAIYGARASNGVVLIKTKEAKVGKTRITTSFRTSITDIGVPYNLMSASQYAKSRNDNVVINRPQNTYQELVDQDLLPFAGQSEQRPFPENAGEGTDFMDAIFRLGFSKNAQASISGGSQSFTQLLSINFDENEGNIINSKLNKFNFRYNSKMKVGKKFTVNTNLQLNYLKNQRVQTSAKTGLSGVVFTAMRMNPNIPLRDEDTDAINLTDENNNFITNPLIEATESDNQVKNKGLIIGTTGVLDITKNLDWTNRFGFNASLNSNQVFNNKKTAVGRAAGGRLFLSDAEATRTTVESFLNYNKRLSDHKIGATFGISYTDINIFRKSELYSNFTFDDLGIDALELAIESDNQSSIRTNETIQSALYRFNYIYKGKYTLTTTGRYDGSSKFSEGEPWGFFPSAALSWDVNKEGFMKYVKAISQFKIRISYGETGSLIGVAPYSTLDTYTIGTIPLLDETAYTATYPSRIANKNLTWETSETLNFGVNLNLFKNRLRTSFDIYERTTNNLLNNLRIPTQNGFGILPVNDGKLDNKGVEIEAAYDVFKNERFSWTTKLNWTKNKTKLLEYGFNEFIDSPPLATNFFGIPGSRTFPGEELGLFYGYNVIGLIQPEDLVDYENGNFNIRTEPQTDENGVVTEVPIFATTGNGPGNNAPGLWKFEDVNGDGKINVEDRKTIGNPNPDFFFGWNNQFRIGQFNISMFIQGSYGNDILNLNKAFTGVGWVGGNSTEDWFNNRWTLENQDNDVNYPSGGGPLVVNAPNSTYIEDGSYVRLKNLSIRYNFRDIPSFKNASIVLIGTNLITLTNYSGVDPEVSTNGNGALTRGVDYSAYPRPKTYSLGINLTF